MVLLLAPKVGRYHESRVHKGSPTPLRLDSSQKHHGLEPASNKAKKAVIVSHKHQQQLNQFSQFSNSGLSSTGNYYGFSAKTPRHHRPGKRAKSECKINFNPPPRLLLQPDQQLIMSLTTPTTSTTTPTTASSSTSMAFPFAIKCKLLKTTFTVPRKCSYCQKLIVLTAYTCQFCRFKCHKRCAALNGSQPNCDRPKLCSLSRLPSDFDDKVFEQVLRENEINANDMDAWLEEYCDVFGPNSYAPKPKQPPGKDDTTLGGVGGTLTHGTHGSGSDFSNSKHLNSHSSDRSSRTHSTSSSSSELASVCAPISEDESTDDQDATATTTPEQLQLQHGLASTTTGQNNNNNNENNQNENIKDNSNNNNGNSSVFQRFCRLLVPWSIPGTAAKTQASTTTSDAIGGTEEQMENNNVASSVVASPRSDVSSSKGDSLNLRLLDLSGSSGFASPVRTPVDEYNESLIRELFQARNVASPTSPQHNVTSPTADAFPHAVGEAEQPPTCNGGNGGDFPLHKRLNWLKYIVGERGAYSQDRVTDSSDVGQLKLANDHCGNNDNWWPEPAFREKICATWPPSGLHINYDTPKENIYAHEYEEDMGYVEDSGDDNCYSNRDSAVFDLGEWHIPYSDLEFSKCLYNGRSMQAYRGRWHGDVIIHTSRASEDSLELFNFIDEVKTLMKIRHENIVLFMGASIDLPRLAVVTSVRKGDSLFETVHLKKQKLSHQVRLQVAKQIAQGMGYLHAKGIVLKTLCSKNVHIEAKVKISMIDDAGPNQAEIRRNRACVPKGSLTYLAPELVSSLRVVPPVLVPTTAYTKESDIYAYGTILYELYATDFPLSNLSTEAIIWHIGNCKRQDLEHVNCPVALKSLIEDCWSCDAGYRPQFLSILSELQHTAALQKTHSSSVPENLHKPKHR